MILTRAMAAAPTTTFTRPAVIRRGAAGAAIVFAGTSESAPRIATELLIGRTLRGRVDVTAGGGFVETDTSHLERLHLLVARLARETASEKWDEEDARPIDAQQWKAALWFALRATASFPRLGEPEISPCGDGSVHFTWRHDDGRRFVIERRGVEIGYSLRRADGTYAAGDCTSEAEALELLQRHLA